MNRTTLENMKKHPASLKIKNIGNLGEADITIDNGCVIAGHNNIGKSTITKIIYSIIKAINFGDKLYEDFFNKVANLTEQEKELEVNKFEQKYNLGETYPTILFIEKLRHKLYLKYIVKYLYSTLGENYLRYGQESGGFIFNHREFELNIKLTSKGAIELNYKGNYEWFKDATLVSSTEVLTYSNLISIADTVITEEFNKSKLVSAQDKDLIDKLNKESVDMLDNNFNLKEGLGFDKFGYSFYKENGNETRIQMLGTGKKLFAIVDKLLQNNSIGDNSLVMFDEPEEGMHPEWQLEFIDKVFNIKMPFVLTTHSPFIIQSLVYHSNKTSEEVKYYVVEHLKEEGCAVSKCELNALNVVKDLTNPMLKVRGF